MHLELWHQFIPLLHKATLHFPEREKESIPWTFRKSKDCVWRKVGCVLQCSGFNWCLFLGKQTFNPGDLLGAFVLLFLLSFLLYLVISQAILQLCSTGLCYFSFQWQNTQKIAPVSYCVGMQYTGNEKCDNAVDALLHEVQQILD